MIMNSIMRKAGALGVHEKRAESYDYCEIVIYNREIAEWIKVIEEELGPASKPAGTKASEEDAELATDLGGIDEGQMLFKKVSGDGTVVAMLWPWQDGEHTTMKIAVVK